MITTKRQIRRDTDRFGGYGTESARSAVISDYDNIGNFAAPSVEQNRNVGNSLIKIGRASCRERVSDVV